MLDMSKYVEIVNIPGWGLEVDISIKDMIEFDSEFLGSFEILSNDRDIIFIFFD